MPHRSDFTIGTFQSLLAEQVTGFGTQLTANHALVHTVVTTDGDVAYRGLRPLEDTEFQIYRVAVDIHFHRIQPVEHISVIVIKITHGILVGRRALLQFRLVVYVSFLHPQQIVQCCRGINRIADPFNIAQIVPLAFFHLHIHVHRLLIMRHHAVFQNHGIPISQFVILLNQVFLVFLVLFLNKFLRTEPTAGTSFLVGLLENAWNEHRSFYLLRAQSMVPLDRNGVYLHLLFLVDADVHDGLVRCGHIIPLQNLDFGILVSLFIEILFNQELRTVYHVRSELVVFQQTDTVFQIFTLSLFHTAVIDLRHTRTLCQLDAKENLVFHHAIRFYRNIREQTVTPETLDSISYFFPRNIDFLADRKPRQPDKHIIVIVLCSLHGNSSDSVGTGHTGIFYGWLDLFFSRLSLHG